MGDKKAPLIIVIILLVIILGMGGYIALDKLILSKRDDNTNSVVSIDDVNIDLNAFYQINDTLSKFDRAFNTNDSNYFGYLSSIDKRLLAKDFNMGAALFVSMHDDLTGTSAGQYVIGGNVKKNFEKIFGKNLAYKPGPVDAGKSYNIQYSASNDNYTYIAPTTSKVYESGYITKSVKTKVEDESVLITRRSFYVEYQGEAGAITQAKIYKNHNKKHLVGTVNLRNNILSEDEVLAKFGSKVEEYVFTFKQNNSVDDYCFFSVERNK